MTDQQKNPEVDKENEAYASDESLFPNNEMKPEKRIGNSVILSSFSFFTSECFGWSDISFPPKVLSCPLK